MALGSLTLALGLALSGKGNEPWHFYASFGVLSGAGLSFIGSVPFTTVLKNWFERKRGLALSFMFFGTGGAFGCYLAIAFLINRVSWRNTFVIEGVVLIGILLPLIILIVRYHPREKCLMPDGFLTAGGTSPITGKQDLQIVDQAWAATEWTLPKAVRTTRFWLLCLSTFSVWGIVTHIVVAHHVAFAIDLGYSHIYASSVLSLVGVMFACGSLAGAVSDRIGRESAMTIATMVSISGIFVLLLMRDTSPPWMLYYHALGLGFGFGMVTPTITAATTDIFQGPKVGSIIGFIWFTFAIGGFIGPWLGGRIFELFENYMFAFLVAIALNVLGCVAIWLAAPRKVRLVSGRSRPHN
jgi:MFS family permease